MPHVWPVPLACRLWPLATSTLESGSPADLLPPNGSQCSHTKSPNAPTQWVRSHLVHTWFMPTHSFTRSITRLAKHSGSDAVMVDYHFNFIRFGGGSPSSSSSSSSSPSSSVSGEGAGGAQPLYINTVREPVPRLLSQYQYVRFAAY